ncbi:PTS system mannose/fructose/sorbose family transporter subunit IID [Amphibacillus sp. Q70]|uniref:PTS system mannose/fructose/sorbose family transporter subunit IID n=1 Tax=Amphibacillus sp. Q70 TaxID=3453416 RepID=UPI003F83E0B8
MPKHNEEVKQDLTKKELRSIFIRSCFVRSALNFERHQNLGFSVAMAPVIEKYYDNLEDKKEAYERHMQLFLTNPMMAATVIGVASAMEKRKAVEKDITGESISAVKTALMSPLAALGDSLISGTIRPLAAGIAASLALQGSILGPIIFFIVMALVSVGLKYFGVFEGYKRGVSFVTDLQQSGLMHKLTEVASVAALTVIGGFIPAVVSLTTPLEFVSGETTIVLQEQLDELMPGLLPLGLTVLIYIIIKKTNIKPMTLIFVTMLLGVLGVYIGIF